MNSTAIPDLLADSAEAREHCDEKSVFACVDRLIALRSTPREAQQNVEEWLVSAYLPRDDANSFVATLRDMPPHPLLAFLASRSGSEVQS